MMYPFGRVLVAAALIAAPAAAQSLSKKADIDFFRDVASRDLAGLAARSDGRLVSGPALRELAGTPPAELLWCVEPGSEPGTWLLGTGPDGRVFEISIDSVAGRYASRELAKVDDAQVFALRRLPDGSILAGTSPKGGVVLLRGGREVARVRLPADSVFDLEFGAAGTCLAATGDPGRIYSIDLARFAAAGMSSALIDDAASLARHGVTLFGSVADRNVRRLQRLSDGRWAAGSSPKGNIYVFGAHGGSPRLLEENNDGEVTDILPDANGGFDASIVYSGETPQPEHDQHHPDQNGLPPLPQADRFTGRTVLVHFPSDGFPDILTARNGEAFYALARHGALVVIAGGERGELSGYDEDSQLGLDFSGSPAARLNAIARVPGAKDRYLVLHNNTPGLALLDFDASGPRSAETHSLDLGQPAEFGAIRFDRLEAVKYSDTRVELRVGNGDNEQEGWTDWMPLTSTGDGWRMPGVRGRFFKLRVSIPAADAQAQLGRAAVYYLPQNRRPQLQEFHFLSPNYGIIPPAESPPSITTTLGQVLQGSGDDSKDKKKDRLLASQVVPSLGTQVAFWTVTAPTGDNVDCTLSIRREGDSAWIPVAVDDRDGYAQFDVSHLPEGNYYTRLAAKEAAPRPEKDRLSAVFETDDLVVDHTPPDLIDPTVQRVDDHWVISVHGRDALSLLDNLECDFNNGVHETVEQPADGIRDGREETFVLEEPVAKVAGATSVELSLTDAAGNTATRRLPLR